LRRRQICSLRFALKELEQRGFAGSSVSEDRSRHPPGSELHRSTACWSLLDRKTQSGEKGKEGDEMHRREALNGEIAIWVATEKGRR